MKGFRYLDNVSTLVLDREICIGCGVCTTLCPHSVFATDGESVKIVDSNLCMECGACALNCPVKAIKVDAGVGCASGMINEWLDSLNIRRKGGDGC